MIDLKNCYTVATKEAKNKLCENRQYICRDIFDTKYFIINKKKFYNVADYQDTPDNLKQIYLVNNEFTDKEPLIKEEESDKFHVEEVVEKQDTISIVDDSGNVYEFEKPSFECVLLKTHQGRKDFGIIGYFKGSNGESYPCEWTRSGRVWKTSIAEANRRPFDLTPISKQWYENEDNFPAMITRGKDTKEISSVANGDFFKSRLEPHGWRLATEKERDSLFCKVGKKDV